MHAFDILLLSLSPSHRITLYHHPHLLSDPYSPPIVPCIPRYDFYHLYLCRFGALLTDMEANGIRVDETHLKAAEVPTLTLALTLINRYPILL